LLASVHFGPNVSVRFAPFRAPARLTPAQVPSATRQFRRRHRPIVGRSVSPLLGPQSSARSAQARPRHTTFLPPFTPLTSLQLHTLATFGALCCVVRPYCCLAAAPCRQTLAARASHRYAAPTSTAPAPIRRAHRRPRYHALRRHRHQYQQPQHLSTLTRQQQQQRSTPSTAPAPIRRAHRRPTTRCPTVWCALAPMLSAARKPRLCALRCSLNPSTRIRCVSRSAIAPAQHPHQRSSVSASISTAAAAVAQHQQ
jgi:hypothetical protein